MVRILVRPAVNRPNSIFMEASRSTDALFGVDGLAPPRVAAVRTSSGMPSRSASLHRASASSRSSSESYSSSASESSSSFASSSSDLRILRSDDAIGGERPGTRPASSDMSASFADRSASFAACRLARMSCVYMLSSDLLGAGWSIRSARIEQPRSTAGSSGTRVSRSRSAAPSAHSAEMWRALPLEDASCAGETSTRSISTSPTRVPRSKPSSSDRSSAETQRHDAHPKTP